MKTLSILIPTYNMEKYLRLCLNSLIIDDLELFKLLEVLIINDGSKDNSSKIAHEYMCKYPNIFKVIDKENGNYGSCINRGLIEAKGKYIKILDADDSFDTANLAKLINAMTTTDADMFISDFDIVSEDGKIKETKRFSLPVNHIFAVENYIDRINSIEMHAVAYKTQNLIALGYTQTEGISYTDSEWVFLPVTTVSRAYYTNNVVYKYLVGRTGQTVEMMTAHKKVGDKIVIIKKLLPLYDSFIKNNPNSLYSDYLRKRLIDKIHIINISNLIVNRDISLAKQFDDYLLSSSPSLYEDSTNLVLSRYIPIKYIRKWRKNGILPSLLISRMYVFLKRVQSHL